MLPRDLIDASQIAAMCPESMLTFAAMSDHGDSFLLDHRQVQRRFERAAAGFDDADFVHKVTRDGLLQRLALLVTKTGLVIDLGSATSSAQRELSRRFAKSHVVSVDMAHAMLVRGREKKPWLLKASYVQARADALPFADHSVDVIFANQLLPWIDRPASVFTEISRVLRKGGLFAFATLGPDSLQEISRAWQCVGGGVHVNHFMDMHDLGDGLVRAGLADPVLDVDRLTISYSSSARLFADLTAAGSRNALRARTSSLTGKSRFEAMQSALLNAAGGDLNLGLELVYGHCWGAGARNDPSDFRIDAGAIPVRRH